MLFLTSRKGQMVKIISCESPIPKGNFQSPSLKEHHTPLNATWKTLLCDLKDKEHEKVCNQEKVSGSIRSDFSFYVKEIKWVSRGIEYPLLPEILHAVCQT